MSYSCRDTTAGQEARSGMSAVRAQSTDEAVLAESLSSPERFGELYSRYFGEVYRYMAGRLGPDAADDLAAETFLAAFRRRSTFDPGLGSIPPGYQHTPAP